VRVEIDDAQLRLMSGTNCVTECLFVATRIAGRGFQIDTVAARASDASASLNSTVRLARTGRLAEIEACGANGNIDRDLVIVGLHGTRENGARHRSSDADAGLGIEGRGIRVHVNLQMGM
jgi:hypothetical protein